jgi:hypothetical protein
MLGMVKEFSTFRTSKFQAWNEIEQSVLKKQERGILFLGVLRQSNWKFVAYRITR